MNKLKQKILFLMETGCVLIALATTIISCNDEGVVVLDDYIVKDTTQENSLIETKWKFVNGFDISGNKLLDTNWFKNKFQDFSGGLVV